MAQLDDMQQHGDSSRTIEQLFDSESPSAWTLDEDNIQHSKKISVIAKVKEKAKKWRQILSKKKHGHDNLPPWGVDDEIQVDPEHHGGSNARQRMFGRLSSNRSWKKNTKKNTSGAALPKSYSYTQRGNTSFPKKNTINDISRAKSLDRSQRGRALSPINSRIEHIVDENNAGILREKLLLLQATRQSQPVEVEQHPISTPVIGKTTETPNESGASEGITIPTESEHEVKRPPTRESDQENEKPTKTESKGNDINGEERLSPTTMKTETEAITMEERNYGKGISVKQYLRNKLEPGEEERALSQVISEVISPRRTPSEKGVVEKVREAVSLLLQSEDESSSLSSLKKSESTSSIPVSSNAHEVEEDSQGRILQAN